MRRSTSSIGTPRPIMATGEAGYASSPGPKVEKGCPDPSVTSRARRTRRRLVGSMRLAASGSSTARRPCSSATSTPPSASSASRACLDLGIATGKAQVVDHGAQVEPGAPDQQGMVTPSGDGIDGGPGGRLELGNGELLVGIDQIEQMVRHLGPIGPAGLRRAHVHAAVDAHGVHRHDLDVTPPPGHRQRRRRLPRRRDADEGNDGQALASGYPHPVPRPGRDLFQPPREVVRVPGRDGDPGQGTGRRCPAHAGRRRREVDQFPLAGPPRQHRPRHGGSPLRPAPPRSARPGPGGGPATSDRPPP